jgi:hypothetical protein
LPCLAPGEGIVSGQTSFPEVAHCGVEGLPAECPLCAKSGHYQLIA